MLKRDPATGLSRRSGGDPDRYPLHRASPRLLRPFALAVTLAYFHYYTPKRSPGKRLLASAHLDRLSAWHGLAPLPDRAPLRRRRALALQLALLHAAGLLDLSAPVLRPAPAAGRWLRAPAVDQFRALADAINRRENWRAVADQLQLHDCLSVDVIAWAGQFLAREAENVRRAGESPLSERPLHDPPPAADESAALRACPGGWRLRLPNTTPPALLFDLVQLGDWRPVGHDGGEVILTPRSVARAAGRGHGPDPAVHLLQSALGRPLAPDFNRQLHQWAARGRAYRLQTVALLETAQDEQLAHILAQRRLRPYILRRLSPRHAVVRADIAPLLDKCLAARGYFLSDACRVTSDEFGKQAGEPTLPGNERSAVGRQKSPQSRWPSEDSSLPHIYLALRIFLGLGEFIPLPVPPPHEQLDLAAAALSPVTLGEMEEIAGRFLEELRAALRGHDAFLPAAGPPDPALLRVIRDALGRDGELTIAYRPLGDRGDMEYEIRDTRSAGDPPPAACHLPLTARRVRPLWLEQRGELYYLHAYCYRAEGERVFRLDRVTDFE
jgi:hypothetical protein